MEGQGDHGIAGTAVGESSQNVQEVWTYTSDKPQGGGATNTSVDPVILTGCFSDKNNFNDRFDDSSLAPGLNWQNVENKSAVEQNSGVRRDRISPLSNANSEGSEREILLDPLSADDESTPLSESRALSTEVLENEQARVEELNEERHSSLSEAVIGPSEEREDISDEELEMYSLENTESVQPEVLAENVIESDTAAYIVESPSQTSETTAGSLGPVGASVAVSCVDSGSRESPSSDDREIIDLKFEDAVGKSDVGSQDDQHSKDPHEDLEAVSDDELPDAALIGDVAEEPTFKLIEGGEDVSSCEDEGPASPDSTYAALHYEVPHVDRLNSNLSYEGSEYSYGNVKSCELTVKSEEVSASQLITEPPGSLALPLAQLEAEPISDEEDLGHGDASPMEVEGGEAGEIKSPDAISSPVSLPDQTPAGLLGEVEPISADENSDTDGELSSGDEDSLSKTDIAGQNSNSNFLESIDSEEDGDAGPALPRTNVSLNNRHIPAVSASSEIFPKENSGEYMETISDEDDSLSVVGSGIKRGVTSTKALEESQTNLSPINKDAGPEKRQIAANFNEHQEELDYEENDGEDGEGKSAEAPKPIEKDNKESGELGEAGGSDKDEGELSDDDCEEGEIKEPGSKKPYVKLTCRFFQRGICTWGVNCRFLHPGVNDKGNYQMIEIPGFKPVGVRARIGNPVPWPEQPEEQIELPPPPIPDVPPVETAWERGLRIAKEQRKKASERKELEPDFEEKCMNLSVDEDRELNKENERMPKIIPKDPYYDQYGLDAADSYYPVPRDPWQTGHYENFEVRYNREHSFSPPYREKPPLMPPPRFGHPYSPQIDKFGRDRIDRREPFRPEIPPSIQEYPPALKRPDEWTDPWRRSKSPQNHQKRKVRSRSRGKRAHRSVSDSSNSSRSSSGSSSGSSRSSRSFNSSTGSSSRSRSPEPVPPAAPDRYDRYTPVSREPPRNPGRGGGGYHNYDQNYRRGGRNYDHSRGANSYNQRGNNRGNFYNNNNYGGGPAGGYPERDIRDRPRDARAVRQRGRSPPDRPLPYVRPRPKSISSHSSSSRSRSRSHNRATSSRSRSRSSSGSSRSSSSSSSSAGSADSEHLYRDLGSPSKNPRGPTAPNRKRTDGHIDRSGKSPQLPNQQGSQRRQGPPLPPPINLDHIPHPRDPKPPLPPPPPPPPPPSSRPESKYASRNAPQAPVKAKDPLKIMGQKSNIKLTLLPKQQQQSSLGSRPNPLDSPPHKRRLTDRDTSPVPPPPPKRPNMSSVPPSQSNALRLAIEKAAKIQVRPDKGKSPPPAPIPQSLPPSIPSSSLSSNIPRARAAVSPQKQPSGGVKARAVEPAIAKTAPKTPSENMPAASAGGTKAKKSMSSRREELLKQLKAVEDAIARKKSKLQ